MEWEINGEVCVGEVHFPSSQGTTAEVIKPPPAQYKHFGLLQIVFSVLCCFMHFACAMNSSRKYNPNPNPSSSLRSYKLLHITLDVHHNRSKAVFGWVCTCYLYQLINK